MSAPPLTEFHKAEYDSLRREIEASVKEARELEKYVLISTAAIWTWLAKDGKDLGHPCLYWIPTILVVLAIFRSIALLLSIRKIAAYLRTFEEVFASKPPNGWETFVNHPRDHSIWRSSAVFWISFFFVTCGVAGFMTFRTADQSMKPASASVIAK
jgi:hypothetical protein